MNKNYKKYLNSGNNGGIENIDPNGDYDYDGLKTKTSFLDNERKSANRSFSAQYLNYDLDNEIEHNNPCYKNNTFTQTFLNNDKDDIFNFTNINKFSPHLSKNSTAQNTMSCENSNSTISNIEAFLNQNLINFDDILKFIVIGEKAVGKSLFVNKFISNSNSEFEANMSNKYLPTESLEIKKTFCKVLDKNIKVELWDTNLSMLNSPIIKTYFKISNGFILIADYERIESFNILEKHIENIINLSNFHNNIFFIINQKNSKKIDPILKELIDNKLKNIQDKYNLNPTFMNLSHFDKNEKCFNKYLHKVLIKKIGEKLTSSVKKKSCLTTTNLYNTTISNQSTKSPNKNKKTPYSNSNNTSPFNIKLSEGGSFMNITQKRTHSSTKRNLSEMFNKLTISDC